LSKDSGHGHSEQLMGFAMMGAILGLWLLGGRHCGGARLRLLSDPNFLERSQAEAAGHHRQGCATERKQQS
jgi:hypothetical protein